MNTRLDKKIAARYMLFALLATVVNLGTQWLSFQLWSPDPVCVVRLQRSFVILAGFPRSPLPILFAMGAGTGAGLVLKYLLDKRWIFEYSTEGLRDDFVKFILYTLMGVVTTVIFWGTELLFDALLPHDWAKYLGGAVGLTIGYTTKFFLDRRFVFRK